MTISTTPYANLDPALILNAIEGAGFICSGSLLALNSYENRVYQVGIEDAQPLIAKFYRPYRWSNEAIIEEHQFAAELLSHEIPVIAPISNHQGQTLYHCQGFRFALFRRQGGRIDELTHEGHLIQMGRFLGRLHAVGACVPFKHRLRLDTNTYGPEPHRYLVDHHFIPMELKQCFLEVCEEVIQKIEQRFKEAGLINYIRIHGDCHIGNVLWDENRPYIIDLDDCLMGPAIQDMWMLLSGGTFKESQTQLTYLLQGYQEFYDFNWGEVYLIESLRALRMIQYAAWLAKRWIDPAFPLNFPWFNTTHYWQELIEGLRKQIDLIDQCE